MSASRDISYIFNHVFLPPKLPQQDDSDYGNDFTLGKHCQDALALFRTHLPVRQHGKWASCATMIGKLLALRDTREGTFLDQVGDSLAEMDIDEILAFHIRAQNAGLVIRKSAEIVSFESFELSPTTKSVMAAKGRLRRCFPGPAIAVDHDRLKDHTFCQALALLITSLDVNTPFESWPKVSKASSENAEIRDTVHPKFVTEMLTGILRGIGRPHDLIRIHKRTRDDVLWDHALKPWRRSSFWLLLRVALQTSLAIEGSHHKDYKSFMIFFMAYILRLAQQNSMSSETLFIMAAKISRRTLKLGDENQPGMQYIHRVVADAHRKLDQRWHSLEQDPDPFGLWKSWSTAKQSFDSYTELSLLDLNTYFDSMKTCTEIPLNVGEFRPQSASRLKWDARNPYLYCSITEKGYSARLALLDLDLWVQKSLDIWVSTNLESESACTVLAELIQKYIAAATLTYANNPEDISLMLLTTMDLWVALDKCANSQVQLLRQYAPGFSSSLFNPLLLPKRAQMKRLIRVEQHIRERRDAARYHSNFIFQDTNCAESFAVQYFDQSSSHQALRCKIEAAAAIERCEKTDELTRKKREHRCLLQEWENCTHEEATYWNGYVYVPYHLGSCRKCQLKQKADELEIKVHEWPLPSRDLEAKSAVFELLVPKAIAEWRDTTFALLEDLLSPQTVPNLSNSDTYTLRNFSGLSGYVQSDATRLQLASHAKPYVVAHYSFKKIPQATEENICVQNGLRYSLYDTKTSQWTTELLVRCDVRKICTFQLPPGSHADLQFALDGTTHTSNEVLARQSDCPRNLNLHEFYSFAMLRSGHRLQWRNIARELLARILNFSSNETCMLVSQAAWQAGCSRTIETSRDSHIDLEEEEFGQSFLAALEDALQTVEGNWQGATALRTSVILTTRLLSLSPYPIIHERCYKLLEKARHISLHWARELAQLINEERDTEELKSLNLRALETALICHSTFDVDQVHLPAVLREDKDVADIIECYINIHDRCPALTENLAPSLQRSIRNFERLSHHLEAALRSRILQDRSGFDNTIERVWAGYIRGSPWTVLPQPNESWLTSQTSADDRCVSVTIHYDVLTGSLLINGSPLTRLPQSYELHRTYIRLFGEKVLDVVPSKMPGMIFETRNELYGQQLHFRMHNSELIVRAQRQKQVYEIIPISAMKGDFPRSFIQNYVHWMDLATRSIEWRPVNNLWSSSEENWHMHQLDNKFVLGRAAEKLLDIRSAMVKAISHALGPLEDASNIEVILDIHKNALSIHLPRLKLDFFLKDALNSLESKQYRGMILDKCQSFGSFTGLVNKLVLHDMKSLSRCVVVPQGSISFAPKGHHVEVKIARTSAAHVQYHTYQIDNKLGRLVDNGNLQSRLFRLYLHATTSHCLVDKLTGRTGTEEALYGLKSAATRSFVTLDSGAIEILEKLACMTPRRQYYPEHLKVMQQVEWNLLPSLSQHNAFYPAVASILAQANAFQIFQEKSGQLRTINHGDPVLLEKAGIRDASFQVDSFGAEAYTAARDSLYEARDWNSNSERELQTFQTARFVDDWSQNLTICPQILSQFEMWAKPVHGFDLTDTPTMGFDIKWLEATSELFPKYWCSLHDFLRKAIASRDKYNIMMLLSTLSYSEHAKQDFVQTLLAFATIPALRMIQPPRQSQFLLGDGYSPQKHALINIVRGHVHDFRGCPEADMRSLLGETEYRADERRRRMYDSAVNEQVQMFVRDLTIQWPIIDVQTPSRESCRTYIRTSTAMQEVRPRFQSWFRNKQFQAYVQDVQAVLNRLHPSEQDLPPYSFLPPVDAYVAKQSYVEFTGLRKRPSPPIPRIERNLFEGWTELDDRNIVGSTKLEELVNLIASRCSTSHDRRYSEDLRKSFEALQTGITTRLNCPAEFKLLLEAYSAQARRDVETIYHTICESLQACLHSITRVTKMLPRLSPTSLLSRLASDEVGKLDVDWKLCLIQYGLSITALQRAERLLAVVHSPGELLAELENPGHQDWNPVLHPEWLLLEIENNILIRRDQAMIAHEMMTPSSGLNSVMQLNMGLGKSSVIVPIVAVELADTQKLVRVVVLKPLAMQMFQLLVKKLGGLVNRRIVYMPISRSLNFDLCQAQQIQRIYKECAQNGSIVLLQPEHILSFELMGLERLSSNLELGNVMVDIQHWLHTNSRDILDESDEILSVKFELIYTMGVQRAVEFSPERWTIIEQVLGVLADLAFPIHERCPNGLEVLPAPPGGFPRVRIIQAQAGTELLNAVALQICTFGLPELTVWYLSPSVRQDLFTFITDPSSSLVSPSIQEFMGGSKSVKTGILLLKGLFASGILKFTLGQKRWRVNYGLDPSRTGLAVPYHAKDSPAARAEFSHPDVTIVLTCLCYYYSGLTDEQIRASFEALLRSDQATEEYERWVKDAPQLPSNFQHLTGVNLSNPGQCIREVFPPLRFAKSMVDFYMSTIVFPSEMKEFPHKLSSSGWDIARQKTHLTTGFSGTNDSRYVLPLSITQCDLPAQLATNAAVLGCLLKPENSFEDITKYLSTGSLDAEVLLDVATALSPPVRVILDVGAQVLEYRNQAFAQAWLARNPEAQAVVFFDDHDELCVQGRHGRKELLQVSPFAKQMDQCLVYLDESHTRGTDLKLPTNFRAIVTLGPDLTKDRLVQACMRMRKLGKGQSVVFCCSTEVQRKILEHNRGSSIDVADILSWCIANTCTQTKRSIELWATQGRRHQDRQAKCSQSLMNPMLVESLLEPEAQSIEERYGHRIVRYEDQVLHGVAQQESRSRQTELDKIRARCLEFGIQSLDTAVLEEEQERELSPENEREQQVELPPKMTPSIHRIHKDVWGLAEHGLINRSSDAFQSAFESFRNTTAFTHFEATAWPADMLVTTDFTNTVCATDGQHLDSFLRPVHWIISCKTERGIEYVVVSPHEAHEVLPSIRLRKKVVLHSYSPRLCFSMQTFEDLSFCAIPAVPQSWETPSVTKQLNLFAGQLYFRSYEDYTALCSFLGLCSSVPDDQIKVAGDAFIIDASRELRSECPFRTSPVAFVRAMVALRRKGQSIKASHVGRILNGELITKDQFE